MPELFLWLLILAVVIVLLVALTRKPSEGSKHQRRPFSTGAGAGHCQACGAVWSPDSLWCRRCGHQARRPYVVDVVGALRVLKQMHDRGRVPDDEHSRLESALQDELRAIDPQALAAYEKSQETFLGANSPSAPGAAPVETGTPGEMPAERRAAAETQRAAQPTERPAGFRPPGTIGPLVTPAEARQADSPTVPPAPAASTAPAEPRQPWTALLKGFMEEKNIRCGELVGGLLIVGCSVGLVVSLWATLSKAVPYFPAFLFFGLTAGIHAAGMYTLRHWKLTSTSRGLLVIAMLLVPLNFMTIVVLSQRRSPGDAFFWISGGLGIAVFALIIRQAGRVLLDRQWPLLAAAILGCSVGQLVIQTAISHSSDSFAAGMGLWTLAAVPLVCYLAAGAGAINASRREKTIGAKRALGAFHILGLGTFAFLLAEGLLVHLVAPTGEGVSRIAAVHFVLGQLAPLASFAAVPAAWLGFSLWRRIEDDELATQRTTAMAIGFLGISVMVLAVGLAWPAPHLLIVVGIVNFAAIVAVALAANLPVLHVPAIACLSGAAVTALHVALGRLEPSLAERPEHLWHWYLSGSSAWMLVLIEAGALVAARIWTRLCRPRDAAAFLWSAGLLAAVSVAVALWAGFALFAEEPNLCTGVFAVTACGSLVVNVWRQLRTAGWLASGLTLVALLHAFELNGWVDAMLSAAGLMPAHPFAVALLLHATLSAIVVVLGALVRYELSGAPAELTAWPAVQLPFSRSAVTSIVVALPWLLAIVPAQDVHEAAALTGWGAGIWLLLGLASASTSLITLSQMLATAAVCFAATSYCTSQDWWQGIDRSFWDARHLYAQGIGLVLWSLLWTGARLAGRGAARFGSAAAAIGRLVAEAQPKLERFFTGFVGFGLLLSTLAGVVPGIWQELGWAGTPAFAVGDWNLHATGTSAWFLLGLVALGLIVSQWERFSVTAVIELVVFGVIVPVLIAALFRERLAVGTALRWGLALYSVVLSVVVSLPAVFQSLARRANWPGWSELDDDFSRIVRDEAVLLTAAPLLLLTLLTFWQYAAGNGPAGPLAGTFWSQLRPEASCAGPLFLFSATLAGFAVQSRSPSLAFSGGMVFNLGASCAYLVFRILAPRTEGIDTIVQATVELLQWNAIASSLYTLAWIAARRRVEPDGDRASGLLTLQSAIAPVINALLVGAASFDILIEPHSPSKFVRFVGQPLGALALVLSIVSVAWSWRGRLVEISGWALAEAGLLIAGLAAAWTAPRTTADNWLAYHMLSVGSIGVAAILTLGKPRFKRLEWTRWNAAGPGWIRAGTTVAALSVLAVLRGAHDDPEIWWSSATCAVVTGLAVAVALGERSQPFAWASAALAGLAVALVWTGPVNDRFLANGGQAWVDSLETVMLAAVVIAAGWQLVDIFWQRAHGSCFDVHSAIEPIQHLVPVMAVCALGAVVGLDLWSRELATAPADIKIQIAGLWGCTLIGAIAASLLAGLWDQTVRRTTAGLFASGLVACGIIVERLGALGGNVPFWLSLSVSVWLAVIALAWHWRRPLAALLERQGACRPLTMIESAADWLPAWNIGLATAVFVTGLWAVVTFDETWKRLAATADVALFVPATAAYVRPESRLRGQFSVLLLAACVAALFGWAIMPVDQDPHFWLQRTIRLMVVLSGLAFLYGVIATRRLGERFNIAAAARDAATLIGGAAVISLGATLVMEGLWYEPDVGAPITGLQIAVVAVALVGLAATCISLAVLPGPDPLGLVSPSKRLYVYVAEGVLSLLFVHIYLTMPWLFHGYLRPYWPFIAMAIGFMGVGLSEFFERMKREVLAEPLRNTAAFLPLLPVLGFWIDATQPQLHAYSSVLFTAGLLYVALAVLRQSWLHGLFAALAGNAGLWALFSEQGLRFIEHPQIWLIPPALCAIAAAQFNRDRLTAAQLTAIRYLAITVIYASSTAEMFIRGIANSLWLPLVLATLSTAGVLLGIALRVRAFLYLGTTFLFLSIVAMVYHAHQNIHHVWPWWAFGISLGIAILTMFGIFEKKRNEVLEVVDRLRQWDP